MRSPWRPLAIATLIAVVAGGAVTANDAAVGPGGDPRAPVSAPRELAVSEEAPTLAYWTPKRMANAVPFDADLRRKPRLEDQSAVMRREGHTIAGVDSADDQAGRVVEAAQLQPAATYPFPFGRRYIENQLRKVSPYRTVGKIFFRRGGFNYVCSGASVVSKPLNVVFTAGHCLNDGEGNWSKNVIFVPGRRTGKNKNPYGIFPARTLWAPEGWAFEGLDAFDVGAFSVKKNAKGKALQKAVGALGFAYNEGRVQHWDVFGYPAVAPFNGDKLTTCATAYATQEDMTGIGPDTNGVGCDMSEGSSGGPWIIRLRRGNLLNGVTAYGRLAMPAARFSPYFDAGVNNLRCAAAKDDKNATSC